MGRKTIPLLVLILVVSLLVWWDSSGSNVVPGDNDAAVKGATISGSYSNILKTTGAETDKKDTDVLSNWEVYKYNEYGFEVSYPQNYKAELSGGHSPVANPEFGMRLSLSSKDNQPGVDIDSIDKADYKDKYQNVEEYIKYRHLNIAVDENVTINDKSMEIYKLEAEDYYFSFFENEDYIFQFSSSSKEVLKKIMMTFDFI